jgi:hypothetical protein
MPRIFAFVTSLILLAGCATVAPTTAGKNTAQVNKQKNAQVSATRDRPEHIEKAL